MRRKKVIIIDDEEKYREGLKEFLSREADVQTFESPDDFSQNIKEPTDLSGVCLVVVDYRFDTFNALEKDVTHYLRDDLSYRGPMVLWSLDDEIPIQYRRQFSAVLPKKYFTLSELEGCLSKS